MALSLWCGGLIAGADALFVAGPASASIVLPNDTTGHAEVTGLVDMSLWWCGRYLSGSDLQGTQLNPADYSYSIDSGDGGWFESVDHRWMQDAGGAPIVVDMGLSTAEVDLVAAIDHGPVPEEALESTVYATNDLSAPVGSWESGDISTIFLNGPTNWLSDDFSTRWGFSQPYRYFAVAQGGPKALWADGDNEIDALCASNGQQPATLTANAGPDQTKVEGSTVVLNASGSSQPGGALTVPGTANIFAAGQVSTVGFAPSGGGAGIRPTQYSGAVVPGGVIQFGAPSGAVYPYPSAPGSGPDGDPGGSPSMAGFSGLSGYQDNVYAPMVGVFLNDTTPTAADTAPPTLDFTGNHDFTDLSPLLRQVFFIGDGQTAGAVLQNFHVPAGATRLFLGVAEGLASGPGYYGDPNTGQWQITPTSASGGLTYAWQLTGASGPPIQLSSMTDVAPSFSVFDEGTYTFEVTVTDGQHSATDTTAVTVTNANPTITQVASDPAATDGLTEVTVSFTDPGIFDSHSVAFSWGDGSPTDIVPAQVGGTGWGYGFSGHRYATTGSKTVSVWVTDADGGISTSQTVTVDVGGAGQGEVVPAGPGAALWATSTTANDTIKVTGSNNRFAGRVHSNREIRVSGSQHQFTGGTEFVTTLNVTGSGAVFNPAAVQAAAAPAPFTYTIVDWRPGGTAAVSAGAAYHNMSSSCQGGGQNRKWQPSNVIAAGVYYVNCNIAISGSNVGGNVTLIADGTIKVSGSGSSWTPYASGLLFLAGSTDSRAVDLSGSGHVFHGSIYAGTGGIELTGSGNTLDCGIVATTARVSGSNNQVGGANCAGSPGGGTGTTVSIGAPPLVVPTLSHTFTASQADIEPGQTLTLSDTVRNRQTGPGGIGGGARVFMPVLLGVDNPNSTPVTVTGVVYKLETHDPTTNTWSTLATTDPAAPAAQRIVTLGLRPNPTTGVTYPTGGNLLDGTVVPAGLLASWAGVATIDLTPAQVNTIMNPVLVDAIRNTAELTVTSTNVRRIARFDDQPLTVLRTAPQADLNHIQSTITSAISPPVTLTDPAVPGFATLTPGQSATGTTSTVVPVPATKSGTETDAAYQARLASIDNHTIYAGAYVRATAGVGDVWAAQQLAATRRHLPILTITATSNTLVPSGVDASWTVTVTNTGTATATAINLTGTLAGPGTITLAGVPATLAPGATATVTATAATAGPSGTHDATFTARWSNTGAAPDSYGPISAAASVRWLTLTEPVTISQIQGNFYPLAPGATSFTATTADTAVFGQNFPNIAFNPPTDVVPGNTFGIGPATVPFTDVTVGVNGTATGTLPAQVGANAAGQGSLTDFQATLTGSLTVTAAGNQTLSVIADDGFTLGIGDGATRVSGPASNTPAVTAMQGFPVMGGHNTVGGVATYEIVVNFPAAGVYDFEIDYLNHPGTATLVFGTAGTATADRVLWLGNDMVGDVFATNLDGTVHSQITGIGRTGMASDGTRLFMGNNVGLIEIRSLDGNTLLDSFVIPRIVYPTEDLAWDTARQRLWRLDNNNILRLINPVTHAQEAEYQLPTTDPTLGTLGGIGLDYDAGRDELVVAYCQQPVCIATNSMVGTVDPDTGTPTGTLFYTPGRFAGGVAHDPTDDTLWIGGHTDVVHYTRTGTQLGTWPRPLPGAYVDGLTLAPSTTPVTNTIPPIIELVLSPASATNTTGTTATVTATVAAADGSPVTGAPVTLTVTGANPQPFLDGITNSVGQTVITYPANNPGTDTIRGSTISGFAPTVSNQIDRTFTGPPVTNPGGGNGNPGPTASNCNPADGTMITVITPLTCTLTPQPGTTITGWTVTLHPADVPAGTTETRTLATGTGTTATATIDPTVLANGAWTIGIIATGSDGGQATTDSSIIVDGQLKLGRFRQTFNDMSVPVAGIPISVNRTYDTLDRLKPGDFGQGWTLELANFKVQTNKPIGLGGWEQYECGVAVVIATYCFANHAQHYVTVTWPDGRTESFDFTPPQAPPAFSFLTTVNYTRRPGSRGNSTLSGAPGDQFVMFINNGNNNSNFYVPLTDEIYNPNRFTLTGHDGTRYLLEIGKGLISATDRNGNTITIDDNGVHSSAGPGIAFTRDPASHRITKITGPDNSTVTYTTDTNGDLTKVTDQINRDITHNYQTGHYLLTATGPGSTPLMTTTYHPDGRIDTITDLNGRTTSVDVDPNLRTETTVSPDGRQTTLTSFDARGNATVANDIFDGTNHPSHFAYNSQDQVTSRTDPNGNTWVATYAASNDLLTFTDASNRTTTLEYSGFGQPSKMTDTNGGYVGFTYDTDGNLSQLRDPDGNIRTYTYNPDGTLAAADDPVHPTTTYTYTSQGWLATITDGNGRTTAYAHDPMGRITVENRPEGTITRTYDGAGRKQNVTGLGTTVSYTFDSLDRMTQITGSTGNWAYTYNGNDKATMSLDGAGTWTYHHDAAGRLDQVTNYVGRTTNLTYTYGGIDTITRPNSVTTSNTYDAAGRLTDINHTGPSGTIAEFHYSLDNNANRTRLDQTVNGSTWTETYGLDTLDRLTSVNYSDTGQTTTYQYSPAGNRSQMTVTGAAVLNGTTSYTYDTAQQLTAMTGPAAGGGTVTTNFHYDGNGNQTGSGADIYTFNSANQMTAATVNGNTYGYQFEPDGLRIRETNPGGPALAAYWDRNNSLPVLVADENGGLMNTYAGATILTQNSSAEELTPLADGLGSVRAIVGPTTAVNATAAFDVYGAPRAGTSGSRLGFAGQETDASGLVNMRARQYDPISGRFLSADPLGVVAPGVRGVGGYAYAMGSPTTYTDRTGLSVLADYGHLVGNSNRYAGILAQAAGGGTKGSKCSALLAADVTGLGLNVVGFFTSGGAAAGIGAVLGIMAILVAASNGASTSDLAVAGVITLLGIASLGYGGWVGVLAGALGVAASGYGIATAGSCGK